MPHIPVCVFWMKATMLSVIVYYESTRFCETILFVISPLKSHDIPITIVKNPQIIIPWQSLNLFVFPSRYSLNMFNLPSWHHDSIVPSLADMYRLFGEYIQQWLVKMVVFEHYAYTSDGIFKTCRDYCNHWNFACYIHLHIQLLE